MTDFPRGVAVATSARSTPAARSLTVLAAAAMALVAGCSDSPTEPNPDDPRQAEFLLVTSIANESGVDGASFIQTIGLDQPAVDNSSAFEQSFRPYTFVNGDDVIVLQGQYGDQAFRYTRASDGTLTEGGVMNLPAGSGASGVAFVSETKAYLSLTFIGRILIFNPQTMTTTGEIDLTALGIARNPSNPSDQNPEPVLLAIRDGKLFVTLHQLVTGFASADGADIAVVDVATDTFEKVITDPRTATPGSFGGFESMFVDEDGDLYVYSGGSYGFVPGQQHGFLRIRSGETDFDPGYFLNLSTVTTNVPGAQISQINAPVYAGGGVMYAMAEVPELRPFPPNFARDLFFQAVRIDLAGGQVTALPLPVARPIGSGLAFHEGQMIFGISTATGVGLYTYDPVSGEVSDGPIVNTAGDPSYLIAFD